MSNTYKRHLLRYWTSKDSSRKYNKTFRRVNKVLLKLDKDFKQLNEIINPYAIQDVKVYWRLNKEKCNNRKYARMNIKK